MTKMTKILLSSATALLFAGCGGDLVDSLTDGTSGSANDSVSLDASSDKSSFTITLKSNSKDGTTHIAYELGGLDYGMNYSGTVTTACEQSAAMGNNITYSCVTHYNTSSPAGDGDDETNSVTFKQGERYNLILKKYAFPDTDTKETVDSFTL